MTQQQPQWNILMYNNMVFEFFRGLFWDVCLSTAPSSASSPTSPRVHWLWYRHLFFRSIVYQKSVQVETFGEQPGPHRGPSHRKRRVRYRIFPTPDTEYHLVSNAGLEMKPVRHQSKSCVEWNGQRGQRKRETNKKRKTIHQPPCMRGWQYESIVRFKFIVSKNIESKTTPRRRRIVSHTREKSSTDKLPRCRPMLLKLANQNYHETKQTVVKSTTYTVTLAFLRWQFIVASTPTTVP